MDSRDLASIASSVAALVKVANRLGDKRPQSVISDEILAHGGFDLIDCRHEISCLKRRGAAARRASRAMQSRGKHLLPPA